MGRSQKALKNVGTGLINKIVLMGLAFASRTIFIRLLGAEYNGVNSLYSNILSVLSLAELGLGNVLMYYLYSALQKNDYDEIISLVNEFKKIYYWIIAAVLVIGIALIPFLGAIVNSDLNYSELVLYYVLYLFNSVASYFVVYRTMVISADQRSYIINNCSTITTVVMYIFQIGYLLIRRDFLGYLLIAIGCTVANNLIQNHYAYKLYPYLKNKSEKKINIDPKRMFVDIKATFLFKVSEKILDQTDSIIISILFGSIVVGYYSNYFIIITYLVNIAGIIANGLVAGFGNLNAEGNNENSFKMFKTSMLMFSMFGTFCVTCYACIIQDFVPLWVGKEYLMNYDVVIAVLAVFYLRMVTNTVWMYRSAMGLFKEVQYVNVIAAVLNIIFSVILGKVIGVAGVIVATALSRLLTSFWYEGKVVLEKMEKKASYYYMTQLKDFITMVIALGVALCISNFITITGILAIIIKLCIAGLVVLVVEMVINYRTEEFRILKDKVFSSLKKS